MEEKTLPSDMNLDAELKKLENDFSSNVQLSPERSTSPSFDANTLHSLQQAEKLVQEAKRTIVEVCCCTVCLNETSLENTQIMDLDEEILEIRCIVAAKFDEANGKRVKTRVGSIIQNELPPINSYNQGQCIDTRAKESSKFKNKKNTKKIIVNKNNSLRNIKVQIGPRIDIRNEMSLSKVEAFEILPDKRNSIPVLKGNTGSFHWKHEACKRGWINDRDSLIDAAVQTSLRDASSIDSFKFAEPVEDVRSRSHPSDLDQNKIHQSKLSRGEEMQYPHKNGEINENYHETLRYKNSDHCKTFIDFLCQMEIRDESKEKEESIHLPRVDDIYECESNHSDSQFSFLDSKAISLVTPDVANFNEILSNIDERLKVIGRVTKSLCAHKKIDINGGMSRNPFNRNNNEKETNMEVLLKPRSRMSSSSSAGSSEIFHPPERFSTPLNKLKIEAPLNVPLQIHKERVTTNVIPVSEPVLLASNNIIDTMLAITKNKYSSSSSNDENEIAVEHINATINSDNTSLHSASSSSNKKKISTTESKMSKETASSFPSYSTDKSSSVPDNNHALKLKSSQEQKDIMTQSVNFEMRVAGVIDDNEKENNTEILQKFQGNLEKTDNSVLLNEDTVRNPEISAIISENKKTKDDSMHVSSNRDGTSNDISGFSSKILEPPSDEKKAASEISNFPDEKDHGLEYLEKPENKEKLEIIKLSREIIVESNKNGSTSDSSRKMTPVISSSSSRHSKRMDRKHSITDYSEGELFLPSSCTHSLGEIVLSNPNVPGNINKILVNLSNHASSPNINITDESSGEVLMTDIDSNSSFGSRGQVV